MYIAVVPNRNSPPAILLREGYREGKNVKSRTLANLTHWAPERIEALRRALRGEFDGLGGDPQSGPIFGVLFALNELARALEIPQALRTHGAGQAGVVFSAGSHRPRGLTALRRALG